MMETHYTPYPALTAALERLDYSGKTILITGGGHGMGIDMCRSFAARRSANIIIVGRNETRIKTTAAKLAAEFPATQFTPIAADISSRDDVNRLFNSLEVSPDVLVNNAGYMPAPEKFQDADLDEWWSGYTINVFGTVLITQSYLTHRRAKLSNTGPGIIITLNTIAAYSFDIPSLSAYGSSKAALARWLELASHDIPQGVARFISIHPGAVATDMGHRAGVIDSMAVTEAALTGDFTAWLASEEASFLAGRFVWVNWDYQQLIDRKQEILDKNLFKTSLLGADSSPFL
ncbi:short-chain dehydrogenase [Trichoderma arundinaceum]|uniref:Short-chain dehydrogenase n=1 Tax=Trichoderma arundinaceum TaxID=490622 RepID=A0A395NK84_TRIAR|nr:short-chain dehydrogenase [Trichoderma arundinaceum]